MEFEFVGERTPAILRRMSAVETAVEKVRHLDEAHARQLLAWLESHAAPQTPPPAPRGAMAMLGFARRGLRMEVVKRSAADKRRFTILPKRWILERTFGWLSKFRRMAKDYEFRTENSEAIILIAATRLMLARSL